MNKEFWTNCYYYGYNLLFMKCLEINTGTGILSVCINISVCFQVAKLLKISTTSLAVMVVALLDWRLDFCQLTSKQLYFSEAVLCEQNLFHYETKDNRWHVFTLW